MQDHLDPLELLDLANTPIIIERRELAHLQSCVDCYTVFLILRAAKEQRHCKAVSNQLGAGPKPTCRR